MRIIAGSRKGSKLFAPKGESTRPTEDRIKENIFNMKLFPEMEGVFLWEIS